MPELPEVESVRRGLERAELHAPLVSLWRSDKPLRIGKAWQDEHLDRLRGLMPSRVHRRGKYLVWQFEHPEAPHGLLVHLGMTGRLVVTPPAAPRELHTHLVLAFADGREVRFTDPRRFGGVRADTLAALWATEPLCELGPEPLSRAFDGATLEARAGRSQRSLREILLDQHVVAGVGNIYALEALFRARLHPLLPARRLRTSAWERLASAVKDVLREAIRHRGTTFRDYRGAHGETGQNQHRLAVYGRAGESCSQCGTPLVGFVHMGRGGVYCPHDQRRSRARWVE